MMTPKRITQKIKNLAQIMANCYAGPIMPVSVCAGFFTKREDKKMNKKQKKIKEAKAKCMKAEKIMKKAYEKWQQSLTAWQEAQGK